MAMQGQLSNHRLGNKYLLGELLGHGGFGEVYQAQNLLLNRPQAIKVILEKHLSNPKFREHFIREAQTLAALDHPNIVHIDDFELEQERAYLVMPFISGGTLHSILVQSGPLPLDAVKHYLKPQGALIRRYSSGMPPMEVTSSSIAGILILWKQWHGRPMAGASPLGAMITRCRPGRRMRKSYSLGTPEVAWCNHNCW